MIDGQDLDNWRLARLKSLHEIGLLLGFDDTGTHIAAHFIEGVDKFLFNVLKIHAFSALRVAKQHEPWVVGALKHRVELVIREEE